MKSDYLLLTCVSICFGFRYSNTDKIACYKPYCLCEPRTASCSGMSLNFIPRFPKFVTSVTMTNTNLTYIGKFGLFNLTVIHTKVLMLLGNSIKYIHPEAFSNLTSLTHLTLACETKLDPIILKRALDNMSKRDLDIIRLTYNEWKYLPRNMFLSFEDNLVTRLVLTGNYFSFVNCSIFIPLTNLIELDLSENAIEKISITNLQTVQKIKLVSNQLIKVPQWCDQEGRSRVPKVKYIDLSKNYLGNLISEYFQCLPKVEKLLLQNVNTGRIQNNTFSNMQSLLTLNLDRVGNPLKEIEDLAFNSSSLETLFLSSTRFRFSRAKFNPHTMFAFCPNLQFLDLRGNPLHLADNMLQKMFMPLHNLKTLKLTETHLQNLPPDLFPSLTSLRKLYLDNNLLSNWDHSTDIFGNMSLEYLNLRNNKISIINETSFPFTILKSLKKLDLANNVFSCTCDQMWFLEWIKHSNITLVDYPWFYLCKNPSNMAGTLLADYRPTKQSCTPWNPLLTMAIVVSVCGTLLLAVVFACVRCQTNIKNYFYLIRVFCKRKTGYIPLDNEDDFEYHAFVVYCDADRKWVHQHFLKRIEAAEGIRLCIHHRDFEVGETITGNIDKYLQKSWKVVVIMSNEFAKSEWCQWEVDVIQERRRRQGRDVVVPIMLKNVDSKHMTSQLRTLLESTSYLKYRTGVGQDLFWKAAIESLRRPLSNPPTAVL